MFFINGRVVGGAQPYPAFKKVIDEELKRNTIRTSEFVITRRRI
jgi:hypothetical protein